MRLIDSVLNQSVFTTHLATYTELNKTTVDLLLNSSPNFNLLYSNLSMPYDEPLSTLNLILPIEVLNFLYGADLDVIKIIKNL